VAAIAAGLSATAAAVGCGISKHFAADQMIKHLHFFCSSFCNAGGSMTQSAQD
jgi:hypothetical protein